MKKSLITLSLILGLLSANANASGLNLTGTVGQFRYHSLEIGNEWAGVSWFHLEGVNIAEFKKHCKLNGNNALIAIYHNDTLAWTMVLQAKSQRSRIQVYVTNDRKIAGFCTLYEITQL